MSVQAITWALKQKLPGISNSVLIVLANYADEENECFPSQGRLSEDTGWSVRAIRDAIADLEQKGLLVSAIRRRRDGSMTSCLYTLMIEPAARGADGTWCSTPRHVVPTTLKKNRHLNG